MNTEATNQPINLQLVESLVQAIYSLSTAEQTWHSPNAATQSKDYEGISVNMSDRPYDEYEY